MIVDKMTFDEIALQLQQDMPLVHSRIDKENKLFPRKIKHARAINRVYDKPIEIVTPNGFHFILLYFKRAKEESEKQNWGCTYYAWFRFRNQINAFTFSMLESIKPVINLHTLHFFQRFRERCLKNEKLNIEDVILQFMKRNPKRMSMYAPSEKHPNGGYYFCNDGLCFCDVNEQFNAVYRTYISWNMLGLDQKLEAMKVRNLCLDTKRIDLAIPDFEFDGDAYNEGKQNLPITQQQFSLFVQNQRKDALQDYAQSQYEIALSLHHGGEWGQNMDEAISRYRAAAEQGHAMAQYDLGVSYYQGISVPKDYNKALYWFRKAAEQGVPEAIYNVGCIYAKGLNVDKDICEASKWFQKAAEQGQLNAQKAISNLYDTGSGVAKDSSMAIYWLTKAAEQGDIKAQFSLGIRYHDGLGVESDYKEAFHWFQLAAIQNDAGAQYFVGLFYYDGKGIGQDDKKAVEWYKKSAVQNNFLAQHNLACCYQDGRGVLQSDTEAAKWFLKAAEQGYDNAECNIGSYYMIGRGVTQDDKKAEYWLSKAAWKGNLHAQANLAFLFLKNDRAIEALPLAQRIVTIQPNDEGFVRLLVESYVKLGKMEEAENEYNRFIQRKRK